MGSKLIYIRLLCVYLHNFSSTQKFTQTRSGSQHPSPCKYFYEEGMKSRIIQGVCKLKLVFYYCQSSSYESKSFAAWSRFSAVDRNNHAMFSYTTNVMQVPGRTRTKFVPRPR